MTEAAHFRLTAIVTCRNAEATLARCLDHLAWHGAEIVVIDNGSTDSTLEIASRHLGGAVVELRHDPFVGAFDLTRQLRLKRDVIRSAGSGWIIHADADEFLDTPDRQPLHDFLRLWDKSAVFAFPCDEIMFLPRSEDECHDAETFESTMQSCIRVSEHDPKQRVFRADAALDLWMTTGGHTVTASGTALAPVALRLRHYFGLSLDQIRAEYYSRVFAPGDLAKLWHSTRRTAITRIVAPEPNLLTTFESLGASPGMAGIPVFETVEVPYTDCGADRADLVLSISSERVQEKISRLLIRAFPDLRIASETSEQFISVPRLAVFAHPAAESPSNDAELFAHAEDWVRYCAHTRHQGLIDPAPYAELRYEDIAARPGLLVATVQRLLLGGPGRVSLASREPIVEHAGFSGRLATITAPLARDLGYG